MSDVVEKKIPAEQQRFVPRGRHSGPRTMDWEVYDRAVASVPHSRFGTLVLQGHATQPEAQAECDRLEALR